MQKNRGVNDPSPARRTWFRASVRVVHATVLSVWVGNRSVARRRVSIRPRIVQRTMQRELQRVLQRTRERTNRIDVFYVPSPVA